MPRKPLQKLHSFVKGLNHKGLWGAGGMALPQWALTRAAVWGIIDTGRATKGGYRVYTENDLQSILAQEKKRWYVLGGISLALLGGVIYSFIIRSQPLTAGLTLALGAVMIFFYDLTIKPVHCYACLLNNLLHGRRRELDCTFRSVDADVSVVDGVKYFALTLEQTDEDGDTFERMLYWDAQKPFPPLVGGERLHILYHDRMVADLTLL